VNKRSKGIQFKRGLLILRCDAK